MAKGTTKTSRKLLFAGPQFGVAETGAWRGFASKPAPFLVAPPALRPLSAKSKVRPAKSRVLGAAEPYWGFQSLYPHTTVEAQNRIRTFQHPFAHRTLLLGGRTLLGAEKESDKVRAPGAGGWKGLIFLHPLSSGFGRFPRKQLAAGFGATF